MALLAVTEVKKIRNKFITRGESETGDILKEAHVKPPLSTQIAFQMGI